MQRFKVYNNLNLDRRYEVRLRSKRRVRGVVFQFPAEPFPSFPSLIWGTFSAPWMERLCRHQRSDGKRRQAGSLAQIPLGITTQPTARPPGCPLYGTAVSLPFLPCANSAIAREQSIVKVSVYTLQFMFIKIKWETRERRRWEGRQDTQDTHTRAPFEECQEFVYQTCPVRDERGAEGDGRQTVRGRK